jgi:hypothetical protein
LSKDIDSDSANALTLILDGLYYMGDAIYDIELDFAVP